MADVLSQDGRGDEADRARRPTERGAEPRGERDLPRDIAGPFEIIIGAEALQAPEPRRAEVRPEPEAVPDEPDLTLSEEPPNRNVAHFGTELLAALVLVGVVGVVVSALVVRSDRGEPMLARNAPELAALAAAPDRNLTPVADAAAVEPEAVPALALETRAPEKSPGVLEPSPLEPSAIDREEREAINAQRHGEYDRALAIYDRILHVDPTRARTLNNKGAVLLNQGDLVGAAACFEAALRVNPDAPDVVNNLGVAARRSGDRAAAEEHFRKALSLDPAANDARFNLALVLVDRGAVDEARECVAPLIALDGLWNIKSEAARLLARLDAEAKPEDAQRELQTAAGIVPEEGLLGDLAALHVVARDFDRAFGEIERTLNRREDPRMLSNRGVVQLQQGHPEAALEDFDRALALAPDLIEARYNRALACEARGDFLGALSSYEQVLAQMPEHVGARHNLSLLYLRGERPQEALTMLQATPVSVQSPALDQLKSAVLERLRRN
jgi:tetratricopeptide (TPR) repeat protein